MVEKRKKEDIIDLSDIDPSNDDQYKIDFLDDFNQEEYVEKSKLDKIVKLIDVLLNNLEQNPDKVMIKWPNRIQDVKTFKNKLNAIIKG